MRSTTEHIPLNSGTGRYIYRVTIDIDSMFDTAYGNFTRKKNIRKNRKKKKKNGAAKEISSRGQLTRILTELPGNRNFFPVVGINSGRTGSEAGKGNTCKFGCKIKMNYYYSLYLLFHPMWRSLKSATIPHIIFRHIYLSNIFLPGNNYTLTPLGPRQ